MDEAILVFGGAGFIGTHLISELVRSGHCEIICVDIKTPQNQLSGVTYLNADIRNLSHISFEQKISRIYNFGAIHTTPGHENHEYYETNITGAIEVTRFATRANVSEIIFTSSISVYGPSEETKNENSQLSPISAYGRSKLMAEEIHRSWASQNINNKLTIVRPSVVFGKGEGGNFTRMTKLLRRGQFVYPGRTDTIKACVYVKDLLHSIEFARTRSENYVLFNAAYPERYTLEKIINTFKETFFPKLKTHKIPKSVVYGIAALLKRSGGFGLGIHPERVLKLVTSTDIAPLWLQSEQYSFPYNLKNAIEDWHKDSNGNFE